MPQSKARNGVPARIYFAVFICILVMSTDEGKRYFQRICVIAPKRKSKVPACDCKKTISVARNATPKLEFKDFYSKFLTVVKCVHTNSKHKRLVSNGLETVIEYLQKPTDTGIFDEIVLTIPDSQLEQMLDKLAKNESWQICEDLLRRAKSTHWLSNDTYIDCIRRLLLSKKLCGAEVKRLRLLNMFLQHGDMLPDRKVANCVQKVLEYNEYRVVRRLIEAGVNPQYLTLQKGDTPYHAAFTIALYKDEGNFDLCKLLLDMHDQFPHKYQFLDPKKDTSAFGLVLTAYDSVHALDAIDILQLHRFSTDVGHSCGHTSINRQNERSDSPPNCNRNKITDTLQNQASLEPKRKAEKHSESVDPACLDLKKQIYCPQTFREKTPDKDENIVQTKPLKPKVFSAQSETPKIELKISQSITRSIKQKSADVPQPLHPERNLREELSSLIKALQASPTAQVGCHQMSKTEMALNIEDGTVGDVDADTNMVKDLEEDSENEDLKDEKCFDDVKFADLEWEVECTDDVCKMMLQRQLTPTLKERVVRRVKLLASGEWRHSLCKRIPTTDKTVRLFEAKLSKAARILWEPAIDVSGRIQPDFGYNESRKTKAIYTEIIRIWDIVLDHDKIHHSKVRIERAHKKGRGSKLTKRMKGVKDRQFEGGLKQRRPMLFFENDDRSGLDGGDDLLYPLASINGNASNILLFYDFDSLVTRALAPNSKDSHVEIPFRPKFNDNFQLSLPVNSPIILQGRSGTGKTTYCLYRMWDCFQDYWKQAVGTTVTRLCDPMRQLFLTRNQVLCSEMQKVFNAYCRGTHFAYKHVEEEGRPLPPRLQEVDAYRYPLFLTLRQLLLMLDASLPRHFFERTTDGSLKFPIPGWGEEKDIFAYIPLDDDWSDDENVGLENISGKGYKFQADTAKETKKRSNSGEVTFDVFANEIWPKLRNKTQMSTCLPILIWTEITSFIKGSEHALTKGFLDKDSYIKVGRKQATNFTVNDREKIYDIFVLYEKYKKDHGYYDECDLVSHIYGRLVKNHHSQLWRFHHIYVDESQDFTQAEMALFIKLSLNTNNMFFTGDSAQSIMHGVSFRFCDLKTLLFNDWKSKPQHKTGKEFQVDESVHQLVHSYRSHTGILSLASGIIDLLKDLFPNSIDNLCRDQGIFDGPKPVLIQSEVLKPHDLASVMRGTLRKNSKINFGARQVILVANDKSKNTLPEELRKARVLTIYESKGLEFDDVLLYNFFKDSQASREWRVVTNCLRKVKLPENHKGQLHPPRPVEFDHDLHKMLNSELKQLYTAITRARFHLWIYDEDTEKRAPMFYYIEARDLAKLNDTEDKWEDNLEDVPQSEEMERLEWNDEGDKMMQRKLYSEAAKCYHNAGLEHKESVANAYQRGTDALQLSGQSSRTEYLQVALLFLKCYLEIQTCTIDILKPREILARNVCTFLGKARELDLAAQMYRKIGLLEPALKLYTRLQKWKTISRIYATMGDLHRAVQILDEREMYEEAIGCIERYQNLKVKDATPLRSKVDCINDDLVRGLSDRAAAFYCRHKQPENALKSVRLLPEEEQLRCLQSHGYYAHDNTLMNSVSTR